jgi:hypothetical protein
MSKKNTKDETKDTRDMVSYDMYIISDRKLYKKNMDGEYKIVDIEKLDDFNNFSNDENICEFLKKICEGLGYQTKNMTGGAKFEFNENKTIVLTDNTNPLSVLEILKYLGFKTCKINDIKYIQTCEQWDKLYNNSKDNNEEIKEKRKNLTNFLSECVNFINRNLGLLNDFSALLDKNDNPGKLSQDLMQIKGELENEICDKLKKLIDGKDNLKLKNININELGDGVEGLVNFIKMMRNSSGSSIQGMQMGGYNNKNIFNSKCGDRMSNILNKLSGAIDERHSNELKNNINNLNNGEKLLNEQINNLVGGDCTNINFENLNEKIQKHIDNSTALSYALFELLRISKENGIDIEEENESIVMPNKVASIF